VTGAFHDGNTYRHSLTTGLSGCTRQRCV
jgi:hypothetical protein